MPKSTTRYEETSDLDEYFREIDRYSLLSREEEAELGERIRQGDESARNRLVEGNLRFAVMIAREYQNRGIELQDLISAGNLGLITAAERFDETRGYKFISYAVWWIRQSILQTIIEQARTIRLPTNRIDLIHKMLNASERAEQEGEKPDLEILAAELNLSIEEVGELLYSNKKPASLDEGIFESSKGKTTLYDIIGEDEAQTEILEQKEEAAILKDVLEKLDRRERRIITLYFGLDSSNPLTLEQIGRYIGITRERVRQLRDQALRKLKHSSNLKRLKKSAT